MKSRNWKIWLLIISSVLFICKIAVSTSDLCLQEKRYLTEKELIERLKIIDNTIENYQDCKVIRENAHGIFEIIVMPISIGSPQKLECVSISNEKGKDGVITHPYWEAISVNSCGSTVLEKRGMTISNEEYLIYKKKNKEFWGEKNERI